MRLTVTCNTEREGVHAAKMQHAENQRIAKHRWFRVFSNEDALDRK